jgi:single-stranded DNA-binding protein
VVLQPAGRHPFLAQITSGAVTADAEGEVRVRCTLVDVTSRRRSEDERERRFVEMVDLNRRLERAQRQLQKGEALASVGRIAVGVASQVATPLAKVKESLLEVEQQLAELLAGTTRPGRGPKPALLERLAESRAVLEQVSTTVAALEASARRGAGPWQEDESVAASPKWTS